MQASAQPAVRRCVGTVRACLCPTLTLYRPFTSDSRRSSPTAPLALRGRVAAGLAPPPLVPLLLALPACIRTFMVSSGWMVLCEAARAMAPATTSCAGFWSGCGGGGGGAGGAAATAGAAIVAVPLVEAAAADTALPSLPVGCRAGGGWVCEGRGVHARLGAKEAGPTTTQLVPPLAPAPPAAHLAEATCSHSSATQGSAQHECHARAGGCSDDALHARGPAAAGRAVSGSGGGPAGAPGRKPAPLRPAAAAPAPAAAIPGARGRRSPRKGPLTGLARAGGGPRGLAGPPGP